MTDKTEQKHSPLPWKSDVEELHEIPQSVVRGGNDIRICRMDLSDAKIEEANADLIVRAVNKHDKLVEACKDWINYATSDDWASLKDEEELIQRTEQALADAEEK